MATENFDTSRLCCEKLDMVTQNRITSVVNYMRKIHRLLGSLPLTAKRPRGVVFTMPLTGKRLKICCHAVVPVSHGNNVN